MLTVSDLHVSYGAINALSGVSFTIPQGAIVTLIGGNGAMMATYRHFPDACICLDVTHATDTPGIDPNKHGAVKLGGGPTLSHGTANHPVMVQRLIEIAGERGIPLQHEASSRHTGTTLAGQTIKWGRPGMARDASSESTCSVLPRPISSASRPWHPTSHR